MQATRKASADRTGMQISRGALASRHSLEGQGALHGWLKEAEEEALARPGRHQPLAATARRWPVHLPIRTATTSSQGMTRGRTTGESPVNLLDSSQGPCLAGSLHRNMC